MSSNLQKAKQSFREIFAKHPILYIPAVILLFLLILNAWYVWIELSHT